MIKAKVIKDNIVTHSSTHLNQAAAEAWFNSVKLTGAFGKLERWKHEGEFSAGESIFLSLESEVRQGPEGDVTYYRFGQEFRVEYEDISAQIAADNLVTLRARKRAFGEGLIDNISALNEAKALNMAAVDAFMSDALITSLREHLYAGNITTFVDKLQSSNVSAYFTNAEKQSVIDQCNNFLNSLGGN